MFDFSSLIFSFAFSPYFFIIGLILIAGYTFYIYRYTVPNVAFPYKLILIILRTTALLLLLFIIFEPIVTYTKTLILEPLNLIYVDNSKSINIEDGTNRKEIINSFLNDADKNNLLTSSLINTFGKEINLISKNEIDSILFNDPRTNFSNIFSDKTLTEQNISSIIILSDGVLTEGSNPVFTAEKLNIPVFTIGVGDTSTIKDIELKNVLYNEILYAETPSIISASISNNGFEGTTVTVSLSENGVILEQKQLILTNGTDNINFSYTSLTPGEKKLNIRISPQPNEFTTLNNERTFFVNVLDEKINIVLISGSPSSDVSFIRNTLKLNDKYKIETITVVGNNQFLETINKEIIVDSSDIIFLLGFPSKETPDNFINYVYNNIKEKNKPFFITLSQGIDYSKLKIFEPELPFFIGRINNDFNFVQPFISAEDLRNPLIQNNSTNISEAWRNLPPVIQSASEFKTKPESKILAKIRVNNITLNFPLILTKSFGSKKSIAVLAKDIWRWKLQTSSKELDLFDRFINNSVKWLQTKDETKQVSIKTTKRIFSVGEEIEFIAQVYDETFNKVSDAVVNVNVNGDNFQSQLLLEPVGSGLYEGSMIIQEHGDYTFNGSATLLNKELGKDNGRFSISEIDIELINPRADINFLKQLSYQTKGEFFYGLNYNPLFEIVKKTKEKSSKEKIITNEISLWSNEWLVIIIILLLALEWFLRKRAGML